MKKYFFNVIFFVFLFFGSLGFNTEIKNDDFEKNKIISNETRVDTISEGQTQIFDSNNVAGNGSNYFEGEFYYLSNIHNETNITYSYQFSLTNVFYYSEINNVINNIELLIYEVDGSGNLIYNSSVNYDSISIGIYEEYLSAENSFTFDESKNIAVKFSVTYDTSLVDESEYIYLSSLDSIVEPKITNINLQENYTTNEYTLDYVLTGDKSLITKIDFFDNDISNTLVQDVDYEILEYDSENTSIPIKIKFLNLSSNTIYDTLKINLTYSTNFSAEGKSFQYNIPTFGTKSENLESAVSIQASNPTSNSIFLDLDVNLSGIQTATLTNIAIKDATTTIKSYDVNLFNETLQLSTTIDSLNKNTTYNWNIYLTYKTTTNNTYNFNFALNEFTTTPEKPEIVNFDVSEVGADYVKLDWEIIDTDLSVNEVKIYDVNNPSHVIYSGSEILNNGFLVESLTESTIYNYGMEIYWKDINGVSLEPVKTNLDFATNPYPPSIILNNSFISVSEESVNITWEFLDSNKILNKVEIIDIESSNVLFEDVDETNGFNNSIEITNLETNKNYNYQMKYYWSFNHPISGELINDSNSFNFTFTTKSYAPIINDFSVVNKNETYITVAWNITDQSSVVENIEIIDKNNSNNIIHSTNELIGEYKIQNLEPGKEYNYELKVKWSSLNTSQNTNPISAELNEKTINNSPSIEELYFEKEKDGMTIYWNIIDSSDIEIQSINIYINNEMIFTTNELNGSLYISYDDLNNIKSGNIKVSVNYIDYFGVEKSIENEIEYNIKPDFANNKNWLWFIVLILILIILILSIRYMFHNSKSNKKNNKKEKVEEK